MAGARRTPPQAVDQSRWRWAADVRGQNRVIVATTNSTDVTQMKSFAMPVLPDSPEIRSAENQRRLSLIVPSLAAVDLVAQGFRFLLAEWLFIGIEEHRGRELGGSLEPVAERANRPGDSRTAFGTRPSWEDRNCRCRPSCPHSGQHGLDRVAPMPVPPLTMAPGL